MIKQFNEFINEASNKVKENAYRELVLFTDNINFLYSYILDFVELLIHVGEKDNKKITAKRLKDDYLKDLKDIINMVEDYNNNNIKKGQADGLVNFNSLSEKDQLSILADKIIDELEEHGF